MQCMQDETKGQYAGYIASACFLAAQPFSNMSEKGFDTCTATCKGSFETNPFEHLYGFNLDDKLQVVHVCTSSAVSPDPTSHGLEMGGDVSRIIKN